MGRKFPVVLGGFGCVTQIARTGLGTRLWIEAFLFSSNVFGGSGFGPSTPFFFNLFFTCVVHIASNIMWQIESKIYMNIKNAICIIAYLRVLIVILDTGHFAISEFKRRISYVSSFIREVTALRCDVNSFKLNTTLQNLRLNYGRKFELGSTFDLEVAFHICQIQCINYRNPYP